MQITEIDPNKKYVLVLPEADREFAEKLKNQFMQTLGEGDKILVIFGIDVTIVPAEQVVGYTTFETI